MADYVFKADPNFNRVILKDVEGNKVFVNSQLELDFYTQPRAGGTLNGGYWEQIGTVGKIPAPVLEQAEQEYQEKEAQGDDLVEFTENLADLNPDGPDGSGGASTTDEKGNPIISPVSASRTSANKFVESIPQGGEIVQSGNMFFILYRIPDTNLLISYEATEDDIRGLYPLDYESQSFRPASADEISSTIPFGNIAELYDPRLLAQGTTPWEGFIDYLDKEADLRPWLEDEEMVFLLAEATLEGRTVTEAEWKTTNWWRTHTQDERDWLLLSQGKPVDELPEDAKSKLQDDKITIRNVMVQNGIANPPETLINWVSDKFTTGQWSDVYTEDQVKLLADPSKLGNRDIDLTNFITSGEVAVDSTMSGQDRVQDLYLEYLGPVFGKLNDVDLAKEAGNLRNDPDYEQVLKKNLTATKKSLYPMYAEDVTYRQFSSPWENFTTNAWGQQIDTSSNTFQEVLKLNDIVKASQYLTKEGLKQGVDKVVNEALDGLKVFGQGVRIQ